MSGALSVLGSVGAGFAISSLLSGGANPLSYIGDALITPYRAIGVIIPDVLIEEVNRDDLEISQHPIEFGSPISDHAFLRPVEVTLRVGWSNSGQYPGYTSDVYQALLRLQYVRGSGPSIFSVFTGKRLYLNMLFHSLVQTSNAEHGDFALMIQATFREVNIVSTSSVQVPASSISSKTDGLGRAPYAQQLRSTTPATNNTLNGNTSLFSNINNPNLIVPRSNSLVPLGPTPLLGGA